MARSTRSFAIRIAPRDRPIYLATGKRRPGIKGEPARERMEELEWNDELYDGERYANGAARLCRGYYIRRTCTREIKDNAKKKIQRRIGRGAGGLRGGKKGERDERVDR